ncbi:hypothetical protein [Pseudanabaena sp. FACHB-2040]|uniref:hypothetical protein n=1 Tax=Pseudanabaena sp. FACHB-2040 TaxID=2692859 RepID=UPI001684D3FC|nr:hypothetical protein [Pseudanabaena sp. FACHB-2040]MBD2257734.1 hypothetical protein [Pseudanabaena sp. FACHB-2040]
MVAVVVSINILVSLLGFYTAWRIWCWRASLAQMADALAAWERQSHRLLHAETTPELILVGQRGAAELRSHYSQLQRQISQLQQLIALVGLLPLGWRWVRRKPESGFRQGRKRRFFRR